MSLSGRTPNEYLHQSFSSLVASSSQIQSLPFRRSQSLALAALASEDLFESLLVRDAEPHELALFCAPSAAGTTGPASSTGGVGNGGDRASLGGSGTRGESGSGRASVVALNLPDLIDSHSSDANKWTATKRPAPRRAQAREKASPLKERRGGVHDPARALKAAGRLLDVYPLPRAREHVEGLLAQYRSLAETNAELEEALKRPMPRPTSAAPPQTEVAAALAEEEAMKREEMELFALQQMNLEKQAELDNLLAQSRKAAAAAKPIPKAPAFSTAMTSSTTTASPPRRVPSTSSSSLRFARPPPPPVAVIAPKASAPKSPARATPLSSPARATTTTRTSTADTAVGSTPPSTSQLRKVTSRSDVLSGTSSRVSPGKTMSTTPTKKTGPASPTVNSGGGGSPNTTPRAVRTAAVLTGVNGSPKTSPARVNGLVKKNKVVEEAKGISSEELEVVAEKVWNGVGDSLRPWARRALVKEGKEVPSPLDRLPFEETMKTLETVLALNASTTEPHSPSTSLAGTLTSEAEDADALPPSPSQMVEYELLNLLLSTLAGRTPLLASSSSPATPPLSITYRDPVLVSSLVTSPSSPSRSTHKREKEPMVSMNGIKLALAGFAKARGWKEELGTTAVYALVSKTVLRIDRRGKEGPMIGLRG